MWFIYYSATFSNNNIVSYKIVGRSITMEQTKRERVVVFMTDYRLLDNANLGKLYKSNMAIRINQYNLV